MNTTYLRLTLPALVAAHLTALGASVAPSVVNCYQATDGGWEIRMSADPYAPKAPAGTRFGVVDGNARLHRRPLFPPADKTLIWSADELRSLERYGFRPLVLAYNEPRFLFDFHSAGGLLGHLQVGLVSDGASKWFHQWSELTVRYVDGRMEYALSDKDFPGVTVRLVAMPLADSAGLVLKVAVAGLKNPAKLIWAYGGASAFFTNYAMDAPEFRFAPGQCARNTIAWDSHGFLLRRGFDKTDVVMNEVFTAARYLTNWQAVIRGGSSWSGKNGFGAPEAFTNSPAALLDCFEPTGSAGRNERPNCVAMQCVALGKSGGEGLILVGMGGRITEDLGWPEAAWRAAKERQDAIAARVVTHTPDPQLDAAVRMMAFATEGTWGDAAILHGGWSWRFCYLGWRGWYGSTCYGWTDRVKRSIQNHTRLGVVRNRPDAGGLGSLLEYSPGIYYNMNEVFLDQVRQYFEYTNDLQLMGEIFPVLVGILDWENRRLQPRNESLYENSLNTWISDSHWYIQGQCTQASAYMLGANRFVAELARRLGKDPSPFDERARKIVSAMQQRLWQPRLGVFAEYRDTRGHGLLHPEPELATIYHSAEFGAADPFQIHQMLTWVDHHLRADATPGGGKLIWSSNWYPNRGRTYTHSTYEMAYGEELNLALTDYMIGRADEAYAIIRATLAGIYNGPTPGGLSCHAYSDGRQRANDEFADAIGMWGRALTEGLFGIMPKRLDGAVELIPQFPADWNEAEIKAPQFSYRWQRKGTTIAIDWTSPVETAVNLHLPLRAEKIDSVRVDGRSGAGEVAQGFDGLSWVQVRTPIGKAGRIVIGYTPRLIRTPGEFSVQAGDALKVRLPGLPIAEWRDPQGVLAQAGVTNGALEALVVGEPGQAMAYVLAGNQPCVSWLPVKFRIAPKSPAPPPQTWHAPQAGNHDLSRWALIDLGGTFNESLTNVLPRMTLTAQPSPLPASQVGFGYWKDHLLQYHGSRNEAISDSAWRSKVGPDGTAWTTDGIPFHTSKTGPNIGMVAMAGDFPAQLDFPVKAAGQTLYLMISGMTFPVQSHVVNLRVTLHYAGGQAQTVELVNPFGIGDCWSTWCGRYHDTAANGFENIGGRTGPAGSSQVADLTQPVALDTEAHLVGLPLRSGAELERVTLEAIANDCLFGVMGATILK